MKLIKEKETKNSLPAYHFLFQPHHI